MGERKMKMLLICGDEPCIRIACEAVSIRPLTGIEFVSAKSLAEGLDRLKSGKFDVIALDIDLPDSRGISGLEKLREHAHGIPIVLLAGTRNERMEKDVLQEGAQDYLLKAEMSGPLFARAIHYAIERAKVEYALRESRERYRSLVANIPGVVYRCANDFNRTMFYMSQQIDALSDYPASDFINNAVRSYASIIHPDDFDMVDQAVRKGVKDRAAHSIEYRICRADGSIRWVHEQGRGVFTHDGSLLYLDGVILDQTDRKKAEEALRRANL